MTAAIQKSPVEQSNTLQFPVNQDPVQTSQNDRIKEIQQRAAYETLLLSERRLTEEVNNELIDVKLQKQRLADELNEKNQHIIELEQKIAQPNLQLELQQKEIDTLRSQIDEARKIVTLLTFQVQSLQAQINLLSNQIAQQNQTITQQNAQIQSQTARIITLLEVNSQPSWFDWLWDAAAQLVAQHRKIAYSNLP